MKAVEYKKQRQKIVVCSEELERLVYEQEVVHHIKFAPFMRAAARFVAEGLQNGTIDPKDLNGEI